MQHLDIEVFKYDICVGLKEHDKSNYKFYWNRDAAEPLRLLHESQEVVVTYNGLHYDLPLIYNYYCNPHNTANAFELSDFIINQHYELRYPKDYWNGIDLMFLLQGWIGLKVIEAIMGWEIRETTIDFRYQYKLTEPQRREVEHYNKQDLDASNALYNKMQSHIQMRLSLAKYLNIPHDFSIPVPTLMGMGLGAHRVPATPVPLHEKCINIPIKHPIKEKMLAQMKRPNSEFSENFTMGDKEYTIANGGLHSTLKCWQGYDVYHVDVKGYYSLLMMHFKLFSRNIPESGIELYKQMYEDRLRLKSTGKTEDSLTADSLKIGLLAIWGATRNYHHILYDRFVGELITLFGELFLMYLIELFTDNNINVINANTDGLIVTGDIKVIHEQIKVWQEYHYFDVEIEQYKRFVQKDVNNYILGNSLEKLKVKGRDFTAIKYDWLFANIVSIPQIPVVATLLSEILFQNEDEIDPEKYVRTRIKNYPVNFYMFIIHHTMKFDGMKYEESDREIQKTNRVYAHKEGETVVKFKGENTYKYPGLPLTRECNQDLSTVNKDDLDIDYEWYVDEVMRKYVTYHGEV